MHVERTPIDADDARAARGGKLGDDEASVTLHEERVNVTKETVPVEKVGLDKKTVRDTETVSEDVAHEEIEVGGDTTQGRGTQGRTTQDRDGDLLDPGARDAYGREPGGRDARDVR